MDEKIKGKAKIEYEIFSENSETIINDIERATQVNNSGDKICYTIGFNNVVIINNLEGSNALLKVKDIFFEDSFIYKNYTMKQLQDEIIKHRLFGSDEDFESIIKSLTDVEKKEHKVFLPVYGVAINANVNFEGIKFISKESLSSILKEENRKLLSDRIDTNVYSQITIKSASKNRAVELGIMRIERIINVLRFFTNSKKRSADLSLNSSLKIRKDGIAISEQQTFRTSSYIGAIHPIKLDDEYFTSNNKLNKVISIENKQSKKTDMEKRVLMAVQWLGMSLSEDDYGMKFTKAMISIEALLQTNTETFSDKLSDTIAFILEENKENRLAVKKDFKLLYGMRSKISHGEHNSIGTYDLYLLLEYATLLIHWTIENVDKFNTIEELNAYINELKFS